jgi:hypothetical protein
MYEHGLPASSSEPVFVEGRRLDTLISFLFVGVLLCTGILIVAVLGRPTLYYEADQTGVKPSIGMCALGGFAVIGGLLLAGIAWSTSRHLWVVIGFVATIAAFLWTARYAEDFADHLAMESAQSGEYKVLDLGGLGAIRDAAIAGALLTAILLIAHVLPLLRAVLARNGS